eukprot:293581_1
MPTFYCLQFTQHQNKFREKHPFESFCNEQNALSGEIVSKRINKAIIGKLHDIILNQVPLDVGLIEIHALFCYATRDLHQLFPDREFVEKTSLPSIAYHKFFYHFLIFGCFLGKQYVKYITLNRHKMEDNDYRSNEALRYCIDTFLPNISKSNMKYKYCDSRRMAISNTLAINYGLNDDIIHSITEFTAFHFEEFLIDVLYVKQLWNFSTEMLRTQIGRFLVEYCDLPVYTGSLFILPCCLLSTCFISSNSKNDATLDNLQYFANVIQFELIGRSHIATGKPLSSYVQLIYGVPHLAIKPWTDATAFIELFEMLQTKYPTKCSIVDLFEKCIDLESSRLPLSILYNGQQNEVRRIQEKDMQLMHQNIDVLFDDFVIKYCTTKAMVMENILYQIINSLIYFLQWNDSNDTNALKEALINKLTHVAITYMVPHIDCNEFIKTSKYKQSLENLKQLTSFETNLFDAKSEETSSDERSKKRTPIKTLTTDH